MKRKEFVNGFASSYPNRLIASMSTSSLLARGANPFWNSLVSFIDMHMVYKAAVCLCDLGIRESFASVHISFVALKKTFCYWLSFKAMHWSNIISKFGTFPCREFNLVISWTFISFFFSLVYIGLMVRSYSTAAALRRVAVLDLPFLYKLLHCGTAMKLNSY